MYEGKEGMGKGKKIVLISGDEEYRSEEAMPMLGKILSVRHGFTCTVLFSMDAESKYIDPNNQQSLPGMKALQDTDLMIVATRFRTPPAEEMKWLEAYLDAGKPVIGLRTATHGFSGKWDYFGLQILGEKWVSHHGEHKREGCRGVIESENAEHPILTSVKDVFGPADVYTVANLPDDATILLRGIVTKSLDPSSKALEGSKNNPKMPLAWLHHYTSPGGQTGIAFCTTMGAAVDFVSEDLRRLIVNASYHLTGLKIPKKANVNHVDPFTPSFYGFWGNQEVWAKRNLQVSDFAIGKAITPVDPPGSPEWPFRIIDNPNMTD